MHKTILWVLMVLAMGCSVPDDERFDEIVGGVRTLPPAVKGDAKTWTANRAAVEWWRRKSGRLARLETAAQVWCKKPDGTFKDYDFSVADLIQCLISDPPVTVGRCFKQFEDYARQLHQLDFGAADCQPVQEPYGQRNRDQHPEWEVDGTSEREIVYALLEATAPPPWLIALIATSGAGALAPAAAWVPRLCPMGADWSCPGSPFLPGATPQPDQPTGGD